MNENLDTFCAEVEKELNALKEIGVRVPGKSFAAARNKDQMIEFINMGISECADLLIALS